MENDKILTNAIKTGDLKGKVGEQNLIYVNQTRVLVVGLGKKKIKSRYYTKSFRFSIKIRYKAKIYLCQLNAFVRIQFNVRQWERG